MNYGGTGPQVGSYGQLPGMAMGQPGQQMMQQQQQQQMQMGMQQQQAGIPNQQRMMMQQGMRPHPVYSGMMPSGPQNMPMYPPSGDHRQLEIMKHWPPLWKSTIAQEKNPEKKKNLFKSYSQQWDVICRQNQMFPNGMGGQGMMPGGHPSQMNMYPPQPGAMPPGAMPGMMNPMMTQQQSKLMPGQQPGGPINMQMRMQGQMPSQAGPGSMQNMIPPSATPQPGSVQQIGSNVSVPSPSAALLGQSPQVINPATPQNPASVQPGSMDAANPASQQDPEYIKLLIEFKKHGDKLRMVGERCDRDKKPLPKAYDRLLEIVDDKRTVQKDLLIKLLRNIQHILETNSLIQPVIEVCKMYSSEEEVASLPKQEKEKKGLLNPFSVVSQHFIRVPDEILENLEQQDLEFEVKRKSSEVAEVPTKRARLDPELEDMKEMPRIEIDCMFGKNGRKWEMSEQATKELHSIPWKIDPDSVPPSYKCPDVTVCIDPQILIVPPLRVQIPVSYPEKNPVVQFDRSFPMSVQISAQLATLFERQLSKSETRSITAIFESYKIACEQMVRLGRSSHSLSLNEKQHRQKLVV